MALTISPGERSYSITWNVGKVQSSTSNEFYLENSKFCFLFEIDFNPYQKEEDWKMYLKKIHPKDSNHVFLISIYVEDKFNRLECLNFTRLKVHRCGIEQIMWRRKSNVLHRYPDLKLDDDLNFVITVLSENQYTKDVKNYTGNRLIQTPSYMEIQPCLESLSNDFNKLMENGLEPDLEIRCGDNTLQIHKAVLIARSKVFAAMLQSDMIEKSKSFVEILDMEYYILEFFLRYLYSGTFPNVDVKTSIELYKAADKYGVNALKVRSTNFLKENLTIENACSILVLADTHCDMDLKQYVTSFMIQKDILLKMEDGKAFCALYPRLALDVLYHAYKILTLTLKNDK